MYRCPKCRYEFELPMWSTYRGELHKAFCPACGHTMSRGPWRRILILIGTLLAVQLVGSGLMHGSRYFGIPGTATPVVAVDAANLRKQPSMDAPVVRTLRRGDAVEVISRADGWTRVRVRGMEGYVRSTLLRE